MATLQNNVGDLNRNSSLHYFGAIPNVTSALMYAAKFKMIIGNVQNFGTFPDDMTMPLAGGGTNNLCLGMYGKGIEYNPGTALPEAYFAHTSQSIAAGNRINIFSNAIFLMQADHAISGTFTDPRGFTSNSWKSWRSHDIWRITNDENAKYSNNPYNTGYLDSLSATGGLNNANPVSWQDGHAYTASEFHAISYPVGDACKNTSGGLFYTFGNGLHNGYQGWNNGTGNTSDLPSHLDGVVGEGWLRDNGGGMTTFLSEANWKKEVDAIEDVFSTTGCYVWFVVNINNTTANPHLVPVSTTPAQVDRWLQYAAASYLIGNNGHGFFEFVENNSIKPWNDDRPVFNISLGAALDTHYVPGGGAAALYRQSGGEYRRRFTSGVAYVNPTTSDIVITTDRTYNYLDGTAVGSTFTLQANHGIVLILAGSGGGGGGTGGNVNFYTDNFARNVAAGGLGTADTGQTYTLQGTAADYSDDGNRAVINTPLTTGKRIQPSGVSKQDVEVYAQIGASELAVGANQSSYIWARVDGAVTTAYRLQLRLTPSNQLQYQTQKLVAGTTTTISGVITETWTPAVGDILAAILHVEGINPTLVEAKVWRFNKDNVPAAFGVSNTDSEATLQVAGSVAFSFFAETGNTNAPYNSFIYYAQADEIVAAPPPPVGPTMMITAPANGANEQIGPGLTTISFDVLANVIDGDGNLVSVTCQVDGNAPIDMTLI